MVWLVRPATRWVSEWGKTMSVRAGGLGHIGKMRQYLRDSRLLGAQGHGMLKACTHDLMRRKRGVHTGTFPHLLPSQLIRVSHTLQDRHSSTHIQTAHTHQACTHVVHRDTCPEPHRHPHACRHKHGPHMLLKPLFSHPGWGRWAGRGVCTRSSSRSLILWKPFPACSHS